MKSNADTCHKLFKKTGLVTDIGNHNLKGKPLGFPYVSKGIYHVFHQYVIRTHERDRLREFLNQNGIGCGIYYPYTMHLATLLSGIGLPGRTL